MRIAISTGGGDAPGLNAVIRAAVLSATGRGWEVYGFRRGFMGLMGEDEIVHLERDSVRGIAHLGGTVLGCSRLDPYRWPRRTPEGVVREDCSQELLDNFRRHGFDALISIGGDGSLAVAHKLALRGLRVVSVPKTIDNDLSCTVSTFGFDTAVSTALDAIDKLHTTAESHDRVFVLEVMGRHAGFIALHAGIAGSADVIVIPEMPYDIERVCAKIMDRDRRGRHFSIVVAAEGSRSRDEKVGDGAVGGVADRLARDIQTRTGKDTRSLVLGHLQRGGSPTSFDRLLAGRFGAAAVRAVAAEKWGTMLALQSPHIVTVPAEEVLRRPRRVEMTHDTVLTALETGISFGV